MEPSAPQDIDQELVQEVLPTGSAAATATAAALRALSRSSRAFVLYDPTNEAIRRFLGEFRDKSLTALELCGELRLDVSPFELTFQKEVVYRESDRERSLAFRLFRDGVRQLTLKRGVTWDELLRLLEILSVRFAGVRQQEDDVVTLLTKAAFRFIEFQAVEGFVADHDEEGEGKEVPEGAAAGHTSAPRAAVPAQFDHPLPARGPARGISFREVPARYLTALQAEEAVEMLPGQTVRLARTLLALAADPATGLPLEEVVLPLGEIRDFLLGERRLAPLLELVDLVRAGPPGVAAVLEPLGTLETLPRLLDACEGDRVPPELDLILSRVPGDHVMNLLRRLAAVISQRPVILALLRPRLRPEAERVIAQLRDVPVEALGDVVGALIEAEPARAVQVAYALAQLPNPEAHYQAAEALAKLASSDDVTALLHYLLENPNAVTRTRTLQVIGRRKEIRSFHFLTDWLTTHAETLSLGEADAVGQAMAEISPQTALGHLSAWLKPQGNLLRRLVETTAQKRIKRAAVTGLGILADPEAEAALKAFRDKADEELRPYVVAVMVRRRRDGGPRG